MADGQHFALLLQGVETWNSWRRQNPKIRPNLSKTILIDMDLSEANLDSTDLSETNLARTNLSNSDLSYANLTNANLSGCKLAKSKLKKTILIGTNLSGADLKEADFSEAQLGFTLFVNNDLRSVVGLKSVTHSEPSSLGIDTIYRSQGEIPEIFLMQAGVPDSFISYMHSLVGHPIEYYTCFISYSSKDQEFVERLYADLQAAGVRCWFAPENLKVGDTIRKSIDESIRLYDKLLLILSDYSVASSWVEFEVEAALAKERSRETTVLFPIRLDNSIMVTPTMWAAHIRQTRHIGNFSAWKSQDEYQKAFSRLIRDLKVAVATEGKERELIDEK